MGFTIRVELLRGVFEAGDAQHDGGAEWPPHPARLFCALVAQMREREDRDTLRWLEQLPPPAVIASDEFEVGVRSSWVPDNRVEPKAGGYRDLPLRKATAMRTWRRTVPSVPIIDFEWSAEPDPADRERLDGMLSMVGYLGRSTSPVLAEITDGTVQVDARTRWVASGTTASGSRLMTVPSPGYLDGLQGAFDDEDQPWSVPRLAVPYAPDQPIHVDTACGAYDELVIVPFAAGKRVAPAHTVQVTSVLRRALQRQLDGGPPSVRGAQRGEILDHPAVMFLGLPWVGHPHASGALFGVALALPAKLDPDERGMILRALASREHLTLGKLGRVGLDFGLGTVAALRPGTWCGPARSWVSALPISCRRFVRKVSFEAFEEEVRASCAHLMLPEPVVVEVSRTPLAAGAVLLRPNHRIRHRGDHATPSFHARVTFEKAVRGPIVLGGMRHYGLGLMLPEREVPA